MSHQPPIKTQARNPAQNRGKVFVSTAALAGNRLENIFTPPASVGLPLACCRVAKTGWRFLCPKPPSRPDFAFTSLVMALRSHKPDT
jgi:hypothetical protein